MLDWTRELLSTPEPEHPKFTAGLSVQMILPPDEVIALLRARLGRLRSRSPHVVLRSLSISRKFPAGSGRDAGCLWAYEWMPVCDMRCGPVGPCRAAAA
jgi:hypothetical protein